MVDWSYDQKPMSTSNPKHILPASSAVTRFLIAICVCLLPSLCVAQSSLRSEITPSSGHIDDLFLFTVTFEGPQERVTPQLQAGGDFDVQLLGPKTSVSIINGQIRSRQQYVYQLTPKREGALQTPEVQATVDGQLLSAPPVAVTIKSASAPQAAPGGGNSEQIFMRQTVSPESAYVGQQIVNAITVYTRVNLRGVRIEDDAADGFWQETISDGQNSQKTLNGVEYGSAQILRALFALKAGTLPLPARSALAQVPVTKRANPFGNFDPFNDDFFQNFFQQTVVQEKKLTSNDLSVVIKPLPPIPVELAQFSRGLPVVGDTSISALYSDTPLKVGESKNVSIVISSAGHLNPVKAPQLRAPSGVKIYDGQTSVKRDTGPGSLVTQKAFNYSVVPTQPGMVRIPGVSLAYFDPSTDSYKLITTQDISLVVTGSPAPPFTSPVISGNQSNLNQTQSSSSEAASSPPGQGASMPYTEKTILETISERVSIQLALLALAAAIALFSFLMILSRNASSQAPRRETLHRIAKASTPAELESCIRTWAARTLTGLRPGATFDEIRSQIRAASSDASTSLALISILDELEIARYSGTEVGSIEVLRRSLTEAVRSWR